jgi:hypothetical protein
MGSRRTGTLATSAFVAAALSNATGHAADIFPVLIDDLAHMLGMESRLRTGVRDRATKPNVVANDVDAVGIFENVLDILLPHAKMSVEIASIMSFVPISHPCAP